MCFLKNLQLFLVLVLLSACTHMPTRIANDAVWISNANWLGRPLPFAPYDQLRLQIENIEKIQLKHRGEAHITVLSPPEYEQVKNFISIQEIEIKFKTSVMNAQWQPVCIGKFSKGNLSTYYVVVKSDDLIEIRKKIKNVAIGSSFNPEDYKPHITLGFTERLACTRWRHQR